MSKIEKCLKSSHSASFGGGGNLLSPRNEDLGNMGLVNDENTSLALGERVSAGQERGQSETLGEITLTRKSSFRETLKQIFNPLPEVEGKCAFTLAEVLITLGIIGIVAAMTLPTLNQAINKKVRAEQVRTVKYKFTKATEKMNSLGLIGPYASTDAFVDELQKHLKIMKRCDSSHLRECWPYDEVDLGNGKTWDISKTKTGGNLKMGNGDKSDYSSDNVGIITADGTPMILSYNKKCEALDPVKQYTWSTSDGKPVTNATAGCVAAVFEINGGAKPNKYGDDVQSFNAGGLGSSCAVEVGSLCFTAPFTPTPLTLAECEAQKNDLGINGCYNDNDYWAGAVKACKDQGKQLPSHSDLAEIAKALYQTQAINSNGGTWNLTYTTGTATSLGLPEPYFCLWSGEENISNYAYFRNFDTTYSHWFGSTRDNSYFQAVCLGE